MVILRWWCKAIPQSRLPTQNWKMAEQKKRGILCQADAGLMLRQPNIKPASGERSLCLSRRWPVVLWSGREWKGNVESNQDAICCEWMWQIVSTDVIRADWDSSAFKTEYPGLSLLNVQVTTIFNKNGNSLLSWTNADDFEINMSDSYCHTQLNNHYIIW